MEGTPTNRNETGKQETQDRNQGAEAQTRGGQKKAREGEAEVRRIVRERERRAEASGGGTR